MTLNQQLLEVAYATRDAWQKLIDRLTEEEAEQEKHFDKTIDQQREEQYWEEKKKLPQEPKGEKGNL